MLSQFVKAGVDVDALAAQLQSEGAKSFVQSWNELLGVIQTKSADLKTAVDTVTRIREDPPGKFRKDNPMASGAGASRAPHRETGLEGVTGSL